LQLGSDRQKAPNAPAIAVASVLTPRRLGAAAREVEPTLDVLHLAGDAVEVLLAPRVHVERHEGGHGAVAFRSGADVVEQPINRLVRGRLLEEGVLADGPMEEIRGRVDDLLGDGLLERLDRLFMDAASREGPAEREGEVRLEESVLGILDDVGPEDDEAGCADPGIRSAPRQVSAST
jgi:hypothetical protein